MKAREDAIMRNVPGWDVRIYNHYDAVAWLTTRMYVEGLPGTIQAVRVADRIATVECRMGSNKRAKRHQGVVKKEFDWLQT